jgi:hypothetical protein
METITVKQIHDEFDMASDALYHEAARNATIDFYKIKKSERLKKLGFTSTIERIEAPKKEEIPIYYKKKYPLLKFITYKQLESICEKYGLIYAASIHFIGEIPEKNLLEIESAPAIDESDMFQGGGPTEGHRGEMEAEIEKLRNTGYGDRSFANTLNNISLSLIRTNFKSLVKVYASSYFVAANRDLFNLKNIEKIEGTHTYRVKDPIVFRWVKGGILIITKWGEEANDPALVIPELN